MNEIQTNEPWDVIGSVVRNIADVSDDFDDADFMKYENTNLEKRLEYCTSPEEKRFEYNASANRIADVKKRKTVCSAAIKGAKIVGWTGIGIGALYVINKITNSKS